jgi:hypothetical protein
MKNLKVGLAIAVLSGGALACAVNSLPPVEVEVGLIDIADAWIDDYRDPGHAAFLDNLDTVGRALYGTAWRTNEFRGYVTLKSGLGDIGLPDSRHIQYVEKPCNQDAIDQAPKDGGSSEGIGRSGVYDDTTWGYISNWYSSNYNDGVYYGEVGEIQPL